MFPNAWENADPFYGSGDSATINLLEAAVTGKLNLSEITEEQFRARSQGSICCTLHSAIGEDSCICTTDRRTPKGHRQRVNRSL